MVWRTLLVNDDCGQLLESLCQGPNRIYQEQHQAQLDRFRNQNGKHGAGHLARRFWEEAIGVDGRDCERLRLQKRKVNTPILLYIIRP